MFITCPKNLVVEAAAIPPYRDSTKVRLAFHVRDPKIEPLVRCIYGLSICSLCECSLARSFTLTHPPAQGTLTDTCHALIHQMQLAVESIHLLALQIKRSCADGEDRAARLGAKSFKIENDKLVCHDTLH